VTAAPAAAESTAGPGLLAEAEAAYRGVLVDAQNHRERAADVVARARAAGAAEAVVVGLRALAWGEHVRLDNVRAQVLLDRAVRIADRPA
jgi:hypothetical protein